MNSHKVNFIKQHCRVGSPTKKGVKNVLGLGREGLKMFDEIEPTGCEGLDEG